MCAFKYMDIKLLLNYRNVGIRSNLASKISHSFIPAICSIS